MDLLIEGAGKQYQGKHWGLRDFSLELGSGVLGLVGPNGAGKSSLMRILATISRPTEGRITWDGEDIVESPNELRAVLGYLPQDFGVVVHRSRTTDRAIELHQHANWRQPDGLGVSNHFGLAHGSIGRRQSTAASRMRSARIQYIVEGVVEDA